MDAKRVGGVDRAVALLDAYRKEKELDERLEIPYNAADTGKMLDRTLEAAVAKLSDTLYQQSGRLVHLVEEPHAAAHAHHLSAILRIRTAAPGFLRDQLSRAVRFVAGTRERKPPQEILEGFLARGEWPLRRLSGVMSSPFLRGDGTVCETPGYDAGTGIVLRPIGGPFPAVPEIPSESDGRAALEFIKHELLHEFPFEGEADLAVALAGYMTPAVRPALPVAPMFAWDATAPGSGKTTGARGIAVLADGGLGPVLALPHEDEAELHKLFEAALLSGEQCLIFDNVSGALRSETLCAAATSPEFQFRILGRSETAKVPNVSTIILTGNNLTLLGDLSQRVLVCRLNPRLERPDRRAFKVPDYIARVRALRPKIIAATLTIARAYLAADCPRSAADPWARYPDFDRLIRAPLLWLGEADVLDTIHRAAQIDPERQELQQVLDAIAAAPLNEAFTTHELIEHAGKASSPVLREALQVVAGDGGERISAKRLGKYLARYAGAVLEDLLLFRHPTKRGVCRWQVIKTHETNETHETSGKVVL